MLDGGGFILYFAVVVIASWFGGLGPSLLALVLSIVASAAFFGAPPSAQPEPAARVLAGLALFFFVGVTTALSATF